MHVKIADIEKVNHQETQTDFLDVTFEVIDEENVVATQKHAFPVDTTKEQLSDYAKSFLASHIRDEKFKEDHAEDEKVNQHVGNLKEELVGSEISAEDIVEPKE